MQELEKILEEIDETIERYGKNPYIDEKITDLCYGMNLAKDIIRKHLSRENTQEITRSSRDNDGWITMEERLPIPNKEVWVTAKRNGNVFTSTDAMTESGYFLNYEKENILAWKEKETIPEPYRPKRNWKQDF